MPLFDLETQVTLIRSASLFLPILAFFGVMVLYPPSHRQVAGLFLAFLWALVSLCLLNPLAVKYGFWQFHGEGGLVLGVPMDLMIGWAFLWGVLPNVLGPQWHGALWAVILLVLDAALMPLLEPVLVLGKSWWLADCGLILFSFLGSRYLYIWTWKKIQLSARSFLQMALYTQIFILWIPLGILEVSHFQFDNLWSLPSGPVFLGLQVFLIFSVLGLRALLEFRVRGGGTPFPMDPPEALVTTGPYAYLRNPMQLTNGLSFLLLGVYFGNYWLLVASLVSCAYAWGFAQWVESHEMITRYGLDWKAYKKAVPLFWPRWTPWRLTSAQFYIDKSGCDLCSDLARVLEGLTFVQLQIVDASSYPGESLERMTYVDGQGFEVSGVKALGRILEHVNFCWAFLGFVLQLPVVSHLGQFFLDALAPPHRVSGLSSKN